MPFNQIYPDIPGEFARGFELSRQRGLQDRRQQQDDVAQQAQDVARYGQMFLALPEQQKAAAYPGLVQRVNSLRMDHPNIPMQYDPGFAPGIAKFVAALSGQPQQEETYSNAGNGFALGNHGTVKPIEGWQQGRAPANLRPIMVPDGSGGEQMMNYDPSSGQFSPILSGQGQSPNRVQFDFTSDAPPEAQAAARAMAGVMNPGAMEVSSPFPSAPQAARVGYKPPPVKQEPDQGEAGTEYLTEDAKALLGAAMEHGYNIQVPSMGYGKQGSKAKADTLNAMAAKWKAAGVSWDDGVSNMIQGKTATQGLTQIQKTYANISGWEASAAKQADIALGLSNKVSRTGAPVFNRWLLAGRKQIAGDPEVSALDNATATLAEEYAKVMTGANGGAATDSARAQAHSMINSAQTAQQFARNVALIRQEMAQRKAGLSENINAQRADIVRGSGAPPKAINTKAEFDALPSGAIYIDNGKQYRKP